MKCAIFGFCFVCFFSKVWDKGDNGEWNCTASWKVGLQESGSQPRVQGALGASANIQGGQRMKY